MSYDTKRAHGLAEKLRGTWIPAGSVLQEIASYLDAGAEEVERLQVEVSWLETPMRARHKRLLAAAEEAMKHFEFQGHSPNCPEAKDLRAAIADCKRDEPR